MRLSPPSTTEPRKVFADAWQKNYSKQFEIHKAKIAHMKKDLF